MAHLAPEAQHELAVYQQIRSMELVPDPTTGHYIGRDGDHYRLDGSIPVRVNGVPLPSLSARRERFPVYEGR